MGVVVEETPPITESGLREVARLAWPLVLNNAVWTAQIFIDRVILNRHHRDDLAATLNAVVIYWAVLNLFFHTTGYVATFVAQYSGAGRPERIGPVVGQALYTALIGGAVFMVAAQFAGPLFQFMGADPDLAALEGTYFQCLCWSGLPTLLSAAANGFFIGRGDSRTVLCVSCVALSVNATLAYLWTFGYGGFAEMGIAGAGWALVCGQWAGAAMSLWLMSRPRHRAEFRTDLLWRFDGRLFRRLLRFGVPNGVFTALETGAFAVLTLVIKWVGKTELAATNMALTLNLVAFLPAMGVGQAVEVLVGKYRGQDRSDLAERRTYTGLAIGWSIQFVMAIAYFAIPGLLLTPFTNENSADEIAMAAILLRFVACYCLFDAANSTFSFALRGAGDTRFVMMVISFLPWLAIVLPSIIAYKMGADVYWMWAIITGYIFLLACVFFARFRNGAWKTMKVIEAYSGDELDDE